MEVTLRTDRYWSSKRFEKTAAEKSDDSGTDSGSDDQQNGQRKLEEIVERKVKAEHRARDDAERKRKM